MLYKLFCCVFDCIRLYFVLFVLRVVIVDFESTIFVVNSLKINKGC